MAELCCAEIAHSAALDLLCILISFCLGLLLPVRREPMRNRTRVREREEEPNCRICWDIASDAQPLLSPCRCAGSIAFVHRHCLVHWHTLHGSWKCSVCRTEMNPLNVASQMNPLNVPTPPADKISIARTAAIGVAVLAIVALLRCRSDWTPQADKEGREGKWQLPLIRAPEKKRSIHAVDPLKPWCTGGHEQLDPIESLHLWFQQPQKTQSADFWVRRLVEHELRLVRQLDLSCEYAEYWSLLNSVARFREALASARMLRDQTVGELTTFVNDHILSLTTPDFSYVAYDLPANAPATGIQPTLAIHGANTFADLYVNLLSSSEWEYDDDNVVRERETMSCLDANTYTVFYSAYQVAIGPSQAPLGMEPMGLKSTTRSLMVLTRSDASEPFRVKALVEFDQTSIRQF